MHVHALEYKEGDQVWLSTKNLNINWPLRKLTERQIGPYTITHIVSPNAVVLKLLPSFKIDVPINVSQLHPYKLPTCKGNSQIPIFLLCDSATHVTLCNFCDSVQSDHNSTCRILSTLTMPFPFLFLCLAIAILFHLHLVSHIISNIFYISYSLLISLPWSTAGCYALDSLCSPPSLRESLEFSLWIPLARYASLSCVVFI